MRPSVAAVLLMLVSAPGLASTPTLAETLLARIARTPPASTPFVQVSYRGVLARPVVAAGTLKWLGGDRLERDTVTPFHEAATVGNDELSVRRGSGEIRRIPLARVPQVSAMLAGFRALLAGDVAALEQDFTLAAEGGAARWVVTLTPRSDLLRQQLRSIVIDGRKGEPRCLTVRDANGDSSITLVGALAAEGLRSVAPLQSALAARCRNP